MSFVKLFLILITAIFVKYLNAQPAAGEKITVEKKVLSREFSDSGANNAPGPAIKTSQPYRLPRLFTTPTAYAVRSYGFHFGGEGNIHSTLANEGDNMPKLTATVGLGNVVELGYRVSEYYNGDVGTDKVMMGLFKLQLVRESRFIPAFSITAGQNLKKHKYYTPSGTWYGMDRNVYECVMSKSLKLGAYTFGAHPSVVVIQDDITEVKGVNVHGGRYNNNKLNYQLGLSWQKQPKTVFMLETKYLAPSELDNLEEGMGYTRAVENNLGVRYYLRNWLCMDAGIRHIFNLDTKSDKTRLHANFVGVIPLDHVYERIANMFHN